MFKKDEVLNFRKIMRGNVAKLEAAGWRNQACRPAKIVFLGATISVATNSLQDQWSLRLAAAMKATALNSGALPLLGWENVLFAPGDLEHVSSTGCIDEDLLHDARLARDAVNHKFHEKELTLTEMQRAMKNDAKELCGLDPTFVIECTFLDAAAQTLLTERMHAKVLNCLPGEEEKNFTFKTVLASLKELSKSPLVVAGGTDMAGELEGVTLLVSKFSEGISPDPERVPHFSQFYRSVLHRLSFFCTWPPKEQAKDTKVTILYGRAALMKAIEDIRAAVDDKGAPTIAMARMKVVRQFEWLLPRKTGAGLIKSSRKPGGPIQSSGLP